MTIRRGEIYFVDLNPVQGREQAGQRPVLVVSSDAINSLPLVVTVVVGTKGENVKRDYPTNVRVSTSESGLRLETVFMCFQLRSLDPNRFSSAQAGHVSENVMQKIEDAIRYCLDLDKDPNLS
ncbi:MAG: type II toxin-antitoxin system PemK/MazF family toxin [Anaerolineae bacterium]|nr:type II toxin-antitoxin system PemK/MazF family toxin [Anaerolineae bacterium]